MTVLVIDACVGRAAGGKAGESLRCSMVLDGAMKVGAEVAMTKSLMGEWTKNVNGWAIGWLAEMTSRGRVHFSPEPYSALFMGVRRELGDFAMVEAAAKDMHLVELALAFDRVVLSRDEASWECFRVASAGVVELQAISWLSPLRDFGACITWVTGGADLTDPVLLAARLAPL